MRRGPQRAERPALERLEGRQLLAAGPEFVVNTLTEGDQLLPDVAVNAAGQSVVVWQDGPDILFQRYDAAGNPVGDNTFIANVDPDAAGLSVAMDDDGDFVVAFTGRDAGDADAILAQRFNAQGEPQGDPIQVNTNTAGGRSNPDVAMDADGDFVVAWKSDTAGGQRVVARRFDAAGDPVTGEILVDNPPASETQTFAPGAPAVAMDDDGDFVVGWTDRRSKEVTKKHCYTDEYGERYCYDYPVEVFISSNVLARRYSAAGNAKGLAHRVATTRNTAFALPDVDVAMDADGDFVVGWQTNRATIVKHRECYEGNCYVEEETVHKGSDFLARRYTAAGRAAKVVKIAKTNQTEEMHGIGVALDADGALAGVWAQGPYAEADTPEAIKARRYSARGRPRGAAFIVNATPGSLASPALGIDAAGDVLAAWQRDGDILGRLFTVDAAAAAFSPRSARTAVDWIFAGKEADSDRDSTPSWFP